MDAHHTFEIPLCKIRIPFRMFIVHIQHNMITTAEDQNKKMENVCSSCNALSSLRLLYRLWYLHSCCTVDRYHLHPDLNLSTFEADYSVILMLDNMYRISTYEKILANSGSIGLALTRHSRSRMIYR